MKKWGIFFDLKAGFVVLQSNAGIANQSGAIITQCNLPGDKKFIPENSWEAKPSLHL